MRTMVTLLMVLALVVGIAPLASADNAGDKLIRGISNLVTGFVEIPRNIHSTSVDHNIFVGLTWGALKGVGYGVGRTAVGAYDTVTFPIPLPDNYAPVVEPEFVFSE